jgi:hypothetical protein
VKDTSELESVLRDWLENPRRVAELAANAERVIVANRGASDRTAGVLKELIG